MEKPELSAVKIVIVTYNAMPWIEQCLTSCGNYDVIVVDNNSSDETLTFIRKNFPKVLLIPQTENLGFGRANNIGISKALQENTSYVFLLNQDAYLDAFCIEQLVVEHQKNNDFGILSPIHLNGKGNRLDARFSNYMAYRNNSEFYSNFVLKQTLKNIYEVPFVNAAAWLLPRKTIETVGGFDPIFFHYGEDDNYCQRVRFHNFKVGVVPRAFVRHDREERIQKPAKKRTINQQLADKERSIKVRFGNINKDNPDFFKKRIQYLKRLRLTLYIRLKLKNIKIINREIELLQSIEEDVINSRSQNRHPGLHYLEK